jgi:hypothetical protein
MMVDEQGAFRPTKSPSKEACTCQVQCILELTYSPKRNVKKYEIKSTSSPCTIRPLITFSFGRCDWRLTFTRRQVTQECCNSLRSQMLAIFR